MRLVVFVQGKKPQSQLRTVIEGTMKEVRVPVCSQSEKVNDIIRAAS